MLRRKLLAATSALAMAVLTLAAPGAARAQSTSGAAAGGEINLYSARHYDTDRALYDQFTKETGIRVRLIEGQADQLIERIRNEGANSPADVFLTVDAARLARAAQAGILAPYGSAVIDQRVPAELRDPQGLWFAMTTRVRLIMYDREKGAPAGLTRYEDLADPRFKGMICARSGAHPYNTSLAASILNADGPEKTEAWARGVVENFARPPQGGDRDQFRVIPSGQCQIAIANSYYLGLYGKSDKPEDQELFKRIGVIFPNQGPGDRGAHVNISGAGLAAHAPNKANALRFLEFMTTHEAQQMFALGNMEYPSVSDTPLHPALASLGKFRPEPVNAAGNLDKTPEALQILQKAGWK